VAGESVLSFPLSLTDADADHFGSAKIAQNVNADEAAVLGAAFYGASLSRQFRTKKIKLQDITAHDIQVSYDSESKSGCRFGGTISCVSFADTIQS
jgi:hypoxia up-regulated 1